MIKARSVHATSLLAMVAFCMGISSPAATAETTPAPADPSLVESVVAAAPQAFDPQTATTVSGQTADPGVGDAGVDLQSTGTLAPVTIAKDPTDGFAVSSAQGPVNLAPNDPAATASTPTAVNGVGVVSTGVWSSTEVGLAPQVDGATAVVQLENAAAPTSMSWTAGLSPDQALSVLSDGSVAVVDTATQTAGAAPPPPSFDPTVLDDPTLGPSPSDSNGDPLLANQDWTADPGAPDSSTLVDATSTTTSVAGSSSATTGSSQGTTTGTSATSTSTDSSGATTTSSTATDEDPPVSTAAASQQVSVAGAPLDPQAQLASSEAELTSADTQDGGATDAVIAAPTAMDGAGQPVPASLSASGDTVTLSLSPSASTTYPVTIHSSITGTSTVGPLARARTVTYGLSDRNPEYYSPLDSGLQGAPLKLKWARDHIAYNITPTLPTAGGNPSDLQWPHVLAWLHAVHASHLTPYVTFLAGPSFVTPVRPTPAQYESAITPLFKALVGLGVRYSGAWNEPNSRSTDPQHVAAGAAALYWIALEHVALTVCPSSCRIVAGEFSNFTKGYLAQYAFALRHDIHRRVEGVSRFPTIWAMHDYFDVTYAWKPGHATKAGNSIQFTNPQAAAFVAALDSDGVHKPAVWLDEEGALQNPSVIGHPARELVDGEDFFSLANTPATNGQIQEANWYEYQAPDDGSVDFDSALIGTDAVPRPPYCVLARNTTQASCGGLNANSPALQAGPTAPGGPSVQPAVTLGPSYAATDGSSASETVLVSVDPKRLGIDGAPYNSSPVYLSIRYGTSAKMTASTTLVEAWDLEHDDPSKPDYNVDNTYALALPSLTPCQTYHYEIVATIDGIVANAPHHKRSRRSAVPQRRRRVRRIPRG